MKEKTVKLNHFSRMTFSNMAEQTQKRVVFSSFNQVDVNKEVNNNSITESKEVETEEEIEITENDEDHETSHEAIMRVEVTHIKIPDPNTVNSENSKPEPTRSSDLSNRVRQGNYSNYSSSASDCSSDLDQQPVQLTNIETESENSAGHIDTEPENNAGYKETDSEINVGYKETEPENNTGHLESEPENSAGPQEAGQARLDHDARSAGLETLQVQDRQISDLLSSEDDAVLLHRPDFYSILSNEDSFEWTFHNEKFSDLDIKFIPSVEERWADGKAKSSLKGNASFSPQPSPEHTVERKTPPVTETGEDAHEEKELNNKIFQKAEVPKLVINAKGIKDINESKHNPSAINVKQTSKTAPKKQVTINIKPIIQSEKHKPPPNQNVTFKQTNFRPTVSNFETKQTNFQPTVSNFETKQTNFQPTVSNFETKQTNFRPTVSNFETKQTNFRPTVSNFETKQTNFQPTVSNLETKVEQKLAKPFQTPFVRDNVVFFQSSPTLTYKRTKLKFLENQSNDLATVTAELEKNREDNLIWSSKVRFSKEAHQPIKYKKPEMSIDKADELMRRRNTNRKLCKLDEVEAKFISNSAAETSTTTNPTSTKINPAADKPRRGSHPQLLLSSSLDSSIKKMYATSTSELETPRSDSKPAETDRSDRSTGQRRSTKDVIQWLFEGRLSEASKLRRRRSSKDLGQAWRNLKGAMAKPGPLKNWISLPSRFKSDSNRTSFKDSSQRPLSALQYFRRWARIVCLMLRAVGLKPKKPVTTNLDFLSWTVVYDEVLGISRLNYDSGTLTFDPEQYKANRELTIRPDVREILRLSAEERTDAQVNTAMKCLQHVVPAFSEFPVRVQYSMLKVCRHEEFESGRVIIRQGHRAENFYFIVSGSAVVTVMDSGENHVHTANLLGKGSSFGDLAFLNMAKRSATVTCRDTVEVICIERDDFINIFLRGVQGKEPAHFAFLREVDLLQGWPVGVLPQDNPRICAYTYVRRGVILSHDSATCDWIVVVVSGTCNIIKAMNDPGQKVASLGMRPASIATRKGSTNPSSGRGSASPVSRKGSASPFSRRQSASPSSKRALRDSMCSPASSTSSYHDNGAENNSNLTKSKRKAKRSVHFADVECQEEKPREDTPKNKRNSSSSRKSEDNRKMRHQLALEDLNLSNNSPGSSLSRGNLETGLAQEKHLAEIEKIFTKKHVLPAIKRAAKLTPAVSTPYTNVQDRPALTLRRGSDAAQNASILRPHRLSTGVQPPALPQVLVQGPDDDDDEDILKEPTKKETSHGEKVFIEVAHLEEGDVFGLEHVLLGNISDVTSCSLVSAGAEVVLINKKFFQKHLTEETAKLIREKIRPLPSEASLKAQLKAQMSWQAFKADLFTRHTQGHLSQSRPGMVTRPPQISRQSAIDRGGYRTASQMS